MVKKRPCNNCDIKVSQSLYKIKYQNSDIPNPVNTNIKSGSYNSAVPVKLDKRYANRKILYWAADPLNMSDPKIKMEKLAYSFHNRGTTKTSSDGSTTFKIMCPGSYRTEMGLSFPHIHFLISNKNETAWLKSMYTLKVTCKINAKQMKLISKSGKFLIIDSQPAFMYDIKHIPNAKNIPHDDLNKMTIVGLKNKIKSLRKGFGKFKLSETPIIVYGYSSKCIGGKKVITALHAAGFANVIEFEDGIESYF